MCFAKFDFLREDIIRVEPFGSIPLIASGIRLVHRRSDYPKMVVFWCIGGRDQKLAAIRKTLGCASEGTEE